VLEIRPFVALCPLAFCWTLVGSEPKTQALWAVDHVIGERISSIEQIVEEWRKVMPDASRYRMTIFRAFPTTAGMSSYYGLTISHGSNYRFWVDLKGAYRGSLPEVGEVISVEGRTVVRIARSDGTTVSKVIAGTDPLPVSEPRGVLQFMRAYTLPAYDYRRGSGFEVALDVCISTVEPPEVKEFERIYAYFRNLVPDVAVSVYGRPDAWFLGIVGYPFIDPFREAEPPPHGEWRNRRMVACRPSVNSGTTCLERVSEESGEQMIWRPKPDIVR
jgi:hypothetical protein